MEKNQLLKNDGTIYRVLAVEMDEVFLIDCVKKTMPKWHKLSEVAGYEGCSERELAEAAGIMLTDEDDMPQKARKAVHERFTVIAGILPFVDDDRLRTEAVRRIAKEKGICVQTVRNYLCQYLAFQNIAALLPKERGIVNRGMTEEEKTSAGP